MSYATFTPRSASITSFKTADGKNLALHFENELNYSRPENQFLGEFSNISYNHIDY